MKEITYINRFYNIFDSKISEFVTTDLLKADIEEKYNNQLMKLDKEDKFYEIKLQTIKPKRLSNLEPAEKFEQKKKQNKKRLNLIDFQDRKNQALTNQKVKSLIDFDEEFSSSIRSIAIEKSSKVNLTTRFLNGKILMFSKLSTKSFVYHLIDVFMFPNQEIKRFMKDIKLTNVTCFKT